MKERKKLIKERKKKFTFLKNKCKYIFGGKISNSRVEGIWVQLLKK